MTFFPFLWKLIKLAGVKLSFSRDLLDITGLIGDKLVLTYFFTQLNNFVTLKNKKKNTCIFGLGFFYPFFIICIVQLQLYLLEQKKPLK